MSERDREHAGERPTGEIRRDGVAVSAGIAIGRAFLVGRDLIKEPRYHVEADDVDSEVARLRKAIASSDKQLAKIKSKLAEEEASSDFHIITAHQLMLHDEHLVDATIGYIKDELINAEWALTKAVGDIRGVFDAIEDDYFRERRSDVDFVGERVLRNLLGKETGPLQPPPDAIVVAYDLSPADTAQLLKAAVAGVSNFRKMLEHVEEASPLRRNVTIEQVGNVGAFLCSDLAAGVTGEISYVDSGYNILGMTGI